MQKASGQRQQLEASDSQQQPGPGWRPPGLRGRPRLAAWMLPSRRLQAGVAGGTPLPVNPLIGGAWGEASPPPLPHTPTAYPSRGGRKAGGGTRDGESGGGGGGLGGAGNRGGGAGAGGGEAGAGGGKAAACGGGRWGAARTPPSAPRTAPGVWRAGWVRSDLDADPGVRQSCPGVSEEEVGARPAPPGWAQADRSPATAMLLETELPCDGDRPGTSAAAALCTFGATRGKSPELEGPEKTNDKDGRSRQRDTWEEGTLGTEGRDAKSEEDAGLTAETEEGEGRRGVEGLELPAVVWRGVRGLDPSVGPWLQSAPGAAGAKGWSRARAPSSSRDPTPLSSYAQPSPGLPHRPNSAAPGPPARVSRLNCLPQGPFHCQGRWEIMEALSVGWPDAERLGPPPHWPPARPPLPRSNHTWPLSRAGLCGC